MPNNVLQAAYKRAVSVSTRPDYYWETAFQEIAADGSFREPCVIVQIMPYSNLGWNRQPPKDEISMVLRGLIGLDVNQIANRTLNPSVRKNVLDVKPGEFLFHEGDTSYSFGLEMKRAEGEKIRALMVGHFGRTSIVQLMFYDLSSNWRNSRSERDGILSSFGFDLETAYDEAQAARTDGSNSVDRILAKGLAGGLVATVLCAAILLLRLGASTIKAGNGAATGNKDAPAISEDNIMNSQIEK